MTYDANSNRLTALDIATSEVDLDAAFEAAGVDLSRPVITSCGSGMTACALAFALHLLGKGDVALYDGSWSEWGSDPETPKVLGEAKV